MFGYDHGEDELIEREKEAKSSARVLVIGLTCGFIGLLVLAGLFLGPCRPAHAAEIAEFRAVHAILGEARGEGYRGMLAVAHAIRNRGNLRGVYGEKADVSDTTPELYQLACKAWAESEDGPDPTHGADHWENIGAFGTPYWAKGKKPTAVIGHHRFFKLRRTK